MLVNSSMPLTSGIAASPRLIFTGSNYSPRATWWVSLDKMVGAAILDDTGIRNVVREKSS